jgi:type 2 lantibiotic biosynthesis protein LanM
VQLLNDLKLGAYVLFRELIDEHLDRFSSHVQRRPASDDLRIDLAAVLESLLPYVLNVLGIISSRILALEFECEKLRGGLGGEQSPVQYLSFLNTLADSSVRRQEFLTEYPRLTKYAMIFLQQWSSNVIDIIESLYRDWKEIRATLIDRPNYQTTLMSLQLGLGDPHCGGQSVAQIHFDSCGPIKYRPKSASAHSHFADLVGMLDGSSGIGFRLPRLLDRLHYAWSEYVPYHSCIADAEVQRFYFRLGYMCFILYLVGASDMHYENVVACGEYPVFIDLETLFTPDPQSLKGLPELNPFTQRDPGLLARSGILPSCRVSESGEVCEDISSLAGGATRPDQAELASKETNPYRALAASQSLRQQRHNIPKLDGILVDPMRYSEYMLKGFDAAVDVCTQMKDQLQEPDGVLYRFSKDRIRFLVRSTNRYGQLRYDLYHPDMCRENNKRYRLWKEMYKVPVHAFRGLVKAEIGSLVENDIPYFYLTPSSTSLFSCRGSEFPEVFDNSPMSSLQYRLKAIEPCTKAALRWELESTFGVYVPIPESESHAGRHQASISGAGWQEQAEEEARKITLKLMSIITHSRKHDVDCFAYRISEGRWSLGSIGLSLYDGLAGLGFAFAYIGRELHNEQALACASDIGRSLGRAIDVMEVKHFRVTDGGYNGIGGVIYALIHLAAVLDNAEMLQYALRASDLIKRDYKSIDEWDVLTGVAGCIRPLKMLADISGSAEPAMIAEACAEHLISHATSVQAGSAWKSRTTRASGAGVAHGGSGIAWALDALACIDSRYGKAAGDARNGEAHYPAVTVVHNGARINVAGTDMITPADRILTGGWCCGSAGVEVSRYEDYTRRGVTEEQSRRLKEVIMVATDQCAGEDHSLCHGDIGNLICAHILSSHTSDQEVQMALSSAKSNLLMQIERGAIRCGSANKVMVPGLMQGLAGIAYGLIWLASRERVPNVLAMQGPICGAAC